MNDLIPRWLLRAGMLSAFALVIGACAVKRPPVTDPPKPDPKVEYPEPPLVDPMAEVPGDRLLPVARGPVERHDCKVGDDDEHARIAFEALGGQVTGFSYYSKWKPRTCSIDVQQSDRKLKWRLTPEGATRVHTPDGVFLIRARPDAYVFEFQNVRRMRYCGMMGMINGSMTVRRQTPEPECSVLGVMNRE